MAKIRAIKSMITGKASDSQPPEAAGGTSSTPAAQGEGAVLALASEQAVGRSKKRSRKDKAEQNLADKDSTVHASTDLGDQTEQPITGPSKRSSAPPVWSPKLSYKGRAVSIADSVYADKDYSFGFNMTKGLLLPVDMKKHDELSDLKVLRLAAKSIVLKNYLAHERMIAVRQSLRDAISDNKAKTAELTNLKAAQEAAEAERDTLSQKLARAEEDKQRVVQLTKARYLAELQKLRDAHKAERDKAVDDGEDRGYVEDERTYEQQVQATKDIFFQCGWKAAVEKVGLGQDAEMFQNPPAAYIPAYIQAYTSVAQKRLIEKAKKAAEEEAAAVQPTEPNPPEASEGAEDREAEQKVVAVADAETEDAEVGLAEQNVLLDLD
ncbi:uncharacterized protein LOC114261275 [Camellia sinensis]|uniref:uncharacterized protein LOC114261275 n=1 Tax=Camellia sinensis TaxID=4442 RepID=UPI00103558B5|nr:uncharacterized protein LOC114261275 [Camellia sinensis]